MAKTLKEAPLATQNARAGLSVGVHWRGIDPEVHLGYRKGERGGVWLVRWRNGGGYRQKRIATADDALKEGVLDYHAAVKLGREIVEDKRKEARVAAEGPVPTVASAVNAYLSVRDARESAWAGRPVASNARNCPERHVLGKEARGKREAITPAPLAAVALHALRKDDLRNWLASLSDTLKTTTRRGLANDFKAALRSAYTSHRRRLDPMSLTILTEGLEVKKDEKIQGIREKQVLTDAQISRVIAAAPRDRRGTGA